MELFMKNVTVVLATVLVFCAATSFADGTGLYCNDKDGKVSVSVEESTSGNKGTSSGFQNVEANFTLEGTGVYSNVTFGEKLGVISAVAKIGDGRNIVIYGYLLNQHSSSGTTWSDGMARDFRKAQVSITGKDGSEVRVQDLICSYEKHSDN